jgi:hypothetical protein
LYSRWDSSSFFERRDVSSRGDMLRGRPKSLMLFLHCWWTLNSWGDESKSMRNTDGRHRLPCCCVLYVDGRRSERERRRKREPYLFLRVYSSTPAKNFLHCFAFLDTWTSRTPSLTSTLYPWFDVESPGAPFVYHRSFKASQSDYLPITISKLPEIGR